ncbi:MAG: protein translocase subunit SecD [Planctomycetes bacterium]|nr:protein translocase subunit SecD [Planctomycetota bacterium]
MVDNVGRKIALILVLAAASVLVLVLPSKPFRLGLDLAGGVRLVYRLDFESAKANGQITGNEDKKQLVEESIAIIRTRVDPDGLREPIIRALGTDRIEIQLPGSAELSGEAARAKLAAPLAGSGDETALRATIELASTDPKALDGFPSTGGVIRIGTERLRYTSRVQNKLYGIERASHRTALANHDTGADVELASDDQIQNAIENLGDLRFYIKSKPAEFVALGTEESAELKRVQEWLAKPENASTSIKVFNALPREAGGPPGNIRWFPNRQEEGQAFIPREQRLISLTEPPANWTFTGDSLARVFVSADDTGFPAVSFEMVDAKRGSFGDFTGAHVDEGMAITLNDEIVSLANISEPLPGAARISGRFTDRYANALVTVLRSGSLKIKPVLEQREDVGATVGQQAVDQGWLMGATAFAFVAGFMSFYYKRLGIYASIGLAFNVLLQFGALAGFQATITMPGIAGIILGIGMAVDANILIFERIREEQESGKKPVQAAKAGFENALSAIIDSNVTTVLAGAILAWIGTGPIKGFAVTLIISVITSMLGALVVVRVLIAQRVKKAPTERFTMRRWLADVNYNVIGQQRVAIGLSIFLIVSGLALFSWLSISRTKDAFGIDFLGGASAKVRTEEPHTKDEVESAIRKIGGEIGESAEIAALPASKVSDGHFTEFRVTFKTSESAESGGNEELFKNEIRAALGDLLQKGPIELDMQSAPTGSPTTGTLYFALPHDPADVAKSLESANFTAVQAAAKPGRPELIAFTATGPGGDGESAAAARIVTVFRGKEDSAGRRYELAEPIPETSIIGRRVVGELRDSALKALLLSMLVTVIYIRVRFAEYSWGFAAIASLLHDILITIGAISFLVIVPWIKVEFDMGTIAVFLTIVGYSINDTIVVFDRIRENLPRMKGTLTEIVNTSINQTFSRTIITSTSMCTILIVLLFNLGTGNALESFAFTMTFGILTGTFSSIFIAAPVFIWLEKRAQGKQDGGHKPPTPQAPAVQTTTS